jgi:signal transduction histidine kinase
MSLQTVFLLLLVISLGISLSLAAYASRRRDVTGALPFTLMMVGQAIWAFSYIFEIIVPDLEAKLLWNNFKYTAADIMAAGLFVFALQYSGRGARLKRARWLLFVFPAITFTLVWIAPFPDLIQVGYSINSSGAFPVLAYSYGPWALLEIVYNAILELVSMVILISHYVQAPRIYRIQIATVITGAIVPLAGALVTTLNRVPIPSMPNLDITPITFNIANPIWALGLFLFHLLDITPIARQFVVNSMHEMVIVLDSRHRIVDLNPAACKIFLEEARQIIGRPFSQILPNWAYLIGGSSDDGINQVEAYLGEGDARRYFTLRRSPIYNWRGAYTGLVILLYDITERRFIDAQVNNLLSLLGAVIESTTNGILVIDRDQNVVTINSKFIELWGLPEKWAVLSSADERFHLITAQVKAPKAFDVYSIELLNNLERECYDIVEMRDGRIIERYIAPYRVGDELVGQVYSCLDVTERKRVERELAQKAEELARSNADLEQFAYVASHDLQEPLRKVIAFSDRLRFKYADVLEEKGLDYLERMESATRRMQAMIDALLNLSRVATHGQPFMMTDLNQVAADTVVDLEIQIEKTGGRVDIGDLPTLEADPTQMHQLFANIVGNALKYHRPELPPFIKVYAVPRPDAASTTSDSPNPRPFCQLFIEDNGVGFDEQYLERIFQPFQRLHNRTMYEGTGMGLAICRKIVERHGGNITAKSTPGRGSTFIVTLPTTQTDTI